MSWPAASTQYSGAVAATSRSRVGLNVVEFLVAHQRNVFRLIQLVCFPDPDTESLRVDSLIGIALYISEGERARGVGAAASGRENQRTRWGKRPPRIECTVHLSHRPI